MKKYRLVTLAVVGLCLSVSFLVSPVLAVEKDSIMMMDGKLMMMHDGREVSRMDRETTLSDGTKIMMNGKIKRKDGKEIQLQEGQSIMLDGKMMEGHKDMQKESTDK